MHKNILDYEFPIIGLSALGREESEPISIPGIERAPHPEGRERAVASSEDLHTRTVADGFLYEDRGVKVYAKFPMGILLSETYPGQRPHNGEAAFMREVSRIWPGVAAHA